MTDERRAPWLGAATTNCPVPLLKQSWIESSLYWMGRQFGTEVFYRAPALPSDGFISATGYSASADQVEALFSHLCQLMMVSRKRVTLRLVDGSAQAAENARRGGKRTVGHFQLNEHGRPVVTLDQSEAADPKILTAIAVHELCHLRLLGERRIGRDRSDGERLTDLLTVFFGFGIFSANAAMNFARADRGWTIVTHGRLDDQELNGARRTEGYRRIGYLSTAEFGYALACYSWLRREPAPDWARYVNPGPLLHLEQGLAYLARIGAVGQLPLQGMGSSRTSDDSAARLPVHPPTLIRTRNP
jgi:hypothetical protein